MMLGIETVPFEYADQGRRHRVLIGSDIEDEVEDFVPPGSEGAPVQLRNVVHPANTTLTGRLVPSPPAISQVVSCFCRSTACRP
jgi:hypothetical protein